jgi:hypothetical protein
VLTFVVLILKHNNMAKVKFSALISEMRGKLNGSVFTKNRYGNALRNKVTPVNRRTPHQQSVKALFTYFSQKWRTLTDDQRNAWNSAVDDFKRNNIFGDSIRPTGSNLFCELNANLAIIGGNELTSPPLQQRIVGVRGFKLNIDSTVGSEKFDIEFDPSPTSPDVYHMVYATRCYSPGKSFIQSEYRIIGVIAPGAITPYDALSDWQDKFGILVSDQMISVKLVPVHKSTGCRYRAANENSTRVI